MHALKRVSKDDNFNASVFLTFQLSKGTFFEMPLRVLTVFSQYISAFLILLAYTHACKSCKSLAYNATCLAPPLASTTTPAGHYLQCIALIALVALHCVAMNCIIALRCIAFHCVASHCIACLALHYDMSGIFCGVSRNQPIAPRFYYLVSCTSLDECVYIRIC